MAEIRDIDPDTVHLAIRVLRGDPEAEEAFQVAVPSGIMSGGDTIGAARKYVEGVQRYAAVRQRQFEEENRSPAAAEALSQARGTPLYRAAFDQESDRLREPVMRSLPPEERAKNAPWSRAALTRGDEAEFTSKMADNLKTGAPISPTMTHGAGLPEKKWSADQIYKLARDEAAEAAVQEFVRTEDVRQPPKEQPLQNRDVADASQEDTPNAGTVTAGVL